MRDFEAMSKKHFDAQAKDYDQKETVYYSKFPKVSCRDVADRLKNYDYKKLLDIGCGTGFLIELLKKQKDARYYGLDLSPEMIKVARCKFDSDVQLAEGSADKLPYDDNTFDVVCCVQSFHHYPYPEKAMSEAYRVLNNGGLYILSDTGCSGIAKYFDNFVFRHFMKSGDYAAYSRKDIEKLMTKCGFSVVSSEKVKGFIFTVVGKKA
ncbi:MAG: methyltransferase domain-containing protein [Clostridia bacterium]|nr:methyltransferase domain-containing protein [Clostridia bacterium]